MAKWADYCIFAVSYNTQHTHINRVKTFPDFGDSLGASGEFTRSEVIDAIRVGTTFVTITKGESKWVKGQPVIIFKINGIDYIKTVDNGEEADNLESLLEF